MKNYYDIIIIPRFEKVKIWNDIYYNKLNKLMIMLEKKRKRKLNIKKYYKIIMNNKLLNFWMRNMKNIKYIFIMKNKMFYYREIIIRKRKKYEVMNWIDWELRIWFLNFSNFNSIENL